MNRFKYIYTSKNGSAATYKHNGGEILRNAQIQAAKCNTTVQSFPPLKLRKISFESYL